MNARIVLFVSIALLVGVGGGFGLGQALSPDPQLTPRLPVAPVDDEDTDFPQTENRPVANHQPDPVRPVSPAPAPKIENTGAAASIAASVRIPPPVGEGVITARFTDTQDRAVAGISARLTFDINALRPKLPQQDAFGTDSEGYMRAMMQYYEQVTRLQVDATQLQISDTDGRVSFQGVPEGQSSFFCRPEGYIVAPTHAAFSKQMKPGEHLDVKLIRAVDIKVRLDVPEGVKPRFAQVHWTPTEAGGVAGAEVVQPNVETTVRVVPGAYKLRASVEGRPGGIVDLNATDPPPTQVFVLGTQPTSGLSGVVTFDGARPSYYAVVVAQVQADLTDQELFSGNRGLVHANASLDQASGRFHWLPPQSGEYAIGLQLNGRLAETQRMWLNEDLKEITLRAPLPQTPFVRVRLVYPASYNMNRPSLSIQGMSTETWIASESEYLLYLRNANQRLPQTARLTASLSGLGTQIRNFSPAVETDLTITFEEAGALTITAEGGPLGLRNLQVNLTELTEGQSGGNTRIDRDASSAWRSRDPMQIQPGRYRVVAYAQSGQGAILFSQEIAITPGHNSLTIKVPDLHTVKLDATEIKLRNNVQIEQVSTGHKFNVNFDSNHTALLTLLPSGQYRMSYRNPSNPRTQSVQDFNVPSSGAIVITR